jgi:hypothetical protein
LEHAFVVAAAHIAAIATEQLVFVAVNSEYYRVVVVVVVVAMTLTAVVLLTTIINMILALAME